MTAWGDWMERCVRALHWVWQTIVGLWRGVHPKPRAFDWYSGESVLCENFGAEWSHVHFIRSVGCGTGEGSRLKHQQCLIVSGNIAEHFPRSRWLVHDLFWGNSSLVLGYCYSHCTANGKEQFGLWEWILCDFLNINWSVLVSKRSANVNTFEWCWTESKHSYQSCPINPSKCPKSTLLGQLTPENNLTLSALKHCWKHAEISPASMELALVPLCWLLLLLP